MQLIPQHAIEEEQRLRRNAYARQWRAQNADRVREYKRKYREANLETIRATARERERKRYALNPEQVREWGRRYTEANRDAINLRRRGPNKEAARLRRTSDPLYERLNQGRARARRAGVRVDLFHGPDLITYWTAHGIDPNACRYCNAGLDWSDVFSTIDHAVPLSKGGGHEMSNVVPACRDCNHTKGVDCGVAA